MKPTKQIKHVGFTGTRWGMTAEQQDTVVLAILEIAPPPASFVARHGDCVGADAQFDAMVRVLDRAVVFVHPGPSSDLVNQARCDGPRHERLLPAPHMKRNANIVNGSDYMIAAPAEMAEQERGGTWATIRMARRARRPLVIAWPDGTISRENWPVIQ